MFIGTWAVGEGVYRASLKIVELHLCTHLVVGVVVFQ